MPVRSTTISFTVEDVPASAAFFVEHLGYVPQMAADGFASLTHPDAAIDVTFLRRGIDVLPERHRDRTAAGTILALVVDDLDAEHDRLRAEGVPITLAMQQEEWGERLFQVEDPNGVVIEYVQWTEGAGPSSWNA